MRVFCKQTGHYRVNNEMCYELRNTNFARSMLSRWSVELVGSGWKSPELVAEARCRSLLPELVEDNLSLVGSVAFD